MPGWSPNAPMRLPTEVKRYYEGTMWSSYNFVAGSSLVHTQTRVFSTPLGQYGEGYDRALSSTETNMTEGGRVPSGLAFTVKGVMVEFMGLTGVFDCQADKYAQHCMLSWEFLNTQIPIGMVSAFPGRTIEMSRKPGASHAFEVAHRHTRDDDAKRGRYYVEYGELPILLPAHTTFNLLLTWGADAPPVPKDRDFQVRVNLLGLTTSARP